MTLRTVVLFAGGCLILVGGLFVQFHDVERIWVRGYAPGIDSPAPAKPFRAALTVCVARGDKARVDLVRAGGAYPLSGWFLPQNELRAVKQCMRGNGWLAMPKKLYLP
ncbi:hypothetical protein KZX46_10495 [Polymorphobacter sp. PAMC 29334]|nr:hypothetical protein KZX46_10495 [Polymorphobacter sp. PAMC 29334]